jgi:glycosyltransferase involved in cell wall biosynthesis
MISTKYCFFLYNTEPGGLEVYLLRFIQHFKGDWAVTVICKSGKTGKLLSGFEQAGAKVIPFKGGYFNFLAWYRMYKIFKTGRFDAVCDLTSNFGGVYMWLASKAGIRNRVAYYGQSTNHFPETFFRIWYDRFVNRLVNSNATMVVLNSITALDNFFPYVQKADERFKVVYNGVDASLFRSEKNLSLKSALRIPANAFVVGHSGRFDEKKNHAAILRLAEVCKNKFDDVYFICCGNGTEKLQPDIDRLGLNDRFLALGYRSDVHDVLRVFDVFFFPSYTEGQPNSLIEAMMAGLPFIASDIDPIKDTIPQHLFTQLVKPHDTDSAFEKLSFLYNRRNDLEKFSCRDWAINKYDANLRFKEFLDTLNKW